MTLKYHPGPDDARHTPSRVTPKRPPRRRLHAIGLLVILIGMLSMGFVASLRVMPTPVLFVVAAIVGVIVCWIVVSANRYARGIRARVEAAGVVRCKLCGQASDGAEAGSDAPGRRCPECGSATP